jgi:ABC-type antimicrobial peptide transport system permease subunit
MTKTYIKIAYRNLVKNKMLSGIHILGLAVAIMTATLLYLTSMHELSYDKSIKDYERVGLIYFQTHPEKGVNNNATVAAPMRDILKSEIPEIKYLSRYLHSVLQLRNGQKQLTTNNKFVDADFLPIFSLPMLSGSNKALDDLNNIVLDEQTAKHLFNSSDIIGQQVEVNLNGQWEPKTISAVLKALPSNSSLNFNTLLRFERNPNYQSFKDSWDQQDHVLFAKVNSEKVDDYIFSQATQSFMQQHLKSSNDKLKRSGASPDEKGDYISLHILPISKYHLNSLGLGNGGSPTFPWMLFLIAGLILFVASSNFVNLSLANSLIRNREIGTRKTLGGTVGQLIQQLWTEALLLCVVALSLGIGLAFLILPEYNAMTNYKLSFAQLFTLRNLIIFILVFIMLTLFAGGYPAWRIARTNIIQNLKGTARVKAGRLRNSLTVLQFSIAMALIVATIVVGSQLHYIANRPLGFDKTEVISIPIGSGIDPEKAVQRMRIELASRPWVKSVSASDMNIGKGRDGSTGTSMIGFEHNGKQIHTNFMCIDYDYIQTLGIQLIAGRDFNRAFSTDTAAVLINKQMAELLGGVDKVLSKSIDMNGKPTVIGVVDNFHFQDLYKRVDPLTLIINPRGFPVEYIFVRIQTDNLSKSIADIEQIWKKINPKANVSPSYLDENTENMYSTEKRFSRIIIAGATTAVMIACLGLFALTLLIINRRIKEIGIRKILGSSVSAIVLLISQDFVKLLFIAFALATPLAWWMLNKWLENFAYHVEPSWWMFALAGTTTIGLALCTIGLQVVKAARANPVDSLRDE